MAEITEEFDFGDNVDTATFEQILEMDDGEEDDAHEFSKSIVFGFFDQAASTFDKMDIALKEKNLAELSSLGHFLKGSSATLGFTKVKDQCEKIQNYGHRKDETGGVDQLDDQKSLSSISVAIDKAKAAYEVVDTLMKEYYAKLEG